MNKGHKRKSHEHRKDLVGEHRWGDTGQIILLVIFFIFLIFDLFVLKTSDSWQELVPWYLRIIVFIPLFIATGFFAQKAHKKVFQEKREEPKVIDTGIFSIIRHPMYFGSILLYLCFVVLSLSIFGLIVFIVIVIFYYYLCRYEEKLLIEKFGDKYIQYMKKVPMMIPFTKLKK